MSDAAPRPSRLLLVVTGVALTLVWGTTWAAIRISLEGFPPFKGVALRFAVAAIVLLAASPLFGVRFGRDRTERWLWLLQTAFSFSIPYSLVYWAEQWVPSGLTSVLFSTFPLYVVVLAYFLLPNERLDRVGLLGIGAGFAGVAVIFSEDFSAIGGRQVLTASLVLLLAPLAAAFAEVSVKRWGHAVHPLSLTAVPMAFTAMVAGVLAAMIEADRPIELASSRPVFALLYLAVAGSAITFTLYFWLLRHAQATTVSLIAYGIPVIAVFVGTMWMNEPITLRIVLGAALVIAGVAFTMRPWKRRPQGHS